MAAVGAEEEEAGSGEEGEVMLQREQVDTRKHQDARHTPTL